MHVQNLSRKEPLPGNRPRRLPNNILRAIDNATHIVGMPRCVKDTFAEIIRYVKQADPLSPIWPTKEAIGKRIGAHKRTVHRHVAWMVANGLVEILEQDRKSHNGEFTYSRMRLTRKAAELVRLIESPRLPEPTSPDAKIALGHTLTEPSYSSSQPAALVNNLPADLAHLTSLGMQKWGIFKLMKMATAKGKRLSDIVTVLAGQVEKYRGNVLSGLLRNRINDNKDYAYIARLAREADAQRALEQAEENRLGYLRATLKGKTFTNAAQNRIYMVDARAQFVQILSAQGSTTAPIRDLAEWKDKLEGGNLMPATPDMEAAAKKNIDRIKANVREQKRQEIKARIFGDNPVDAPLQRPRKVEIEELSQLSPQEQRFMSTIEKLPKGRAAAMAAIKALLPKRASRQESALEPFLCAG